jgi:hypothetical protein
MKSTAKIDAKKFRAIKLLLDAGSTYREAAEYMEISLSTVGRIAATDTYEEYKQLTRSSYYAIKKAAEAKKKPAEPEKAEQPEPEQGIKTTGGTLSNSYQINRMYEMMKQMTETMVLISNKLGYIVDDLCGIPKGGDGK